MLKENPMKRLILLVVGMALAVAPTVAQGTAQTKPWTSRARGR